MSNYKNQVLELVKQRPGVRVFQISDLLDLDVDIVEAILAQAVREEAICFEVVKGANGLPTRTYSLPGAVAPEAKPKIDIVVDLNADSEVGNHAVSASPSTESVQAPATAPSQAVTAEATSVPVDVKGHARPTVKAASESAISRRIRKEGESKASLALIYLEQHGATDRATLMKVMGLSQRYQVDQFLKGHIKKGRIARIEDIYCIPNYPAAGATATVVASAPAAAPISTTTVPVADPVHSPAHYTSGGIEVIDVLRAKLSPEEFRGFLKGNVIKYMLRAEHKGGAQDYKKGCVYANWLAEQSVANAA